MAYATVEDVQTRMARDLSLTEQTVCSALLDDAAVMIDSCNADASEGAKKIVSCRMVIRALGSGGDMGVPVGATQGSMSALGYSQSWTVAAGSVGELYIGKADQRLLGASGLIGSKSPLEDLCSTSEGGGSQ